MSCSLTILRADIVTAIQDAVPGALVYEKHPLEMEQSAIKKTLIKEGRIYSWWIDFLSPSLGHNVGGTVDFEAEVRIVGIVSLKTGSASSTQTDMEDATMAVMAALQAQIAPLRSLRVIDMVAAKFSGRSVLRAELSCLFYSLVGV